MFLINGGRIPEKNLFHQGAAGRERKKETRFQFARKKKRVGKLKTAAGREDFH